MKLNKSNRVMWLFESLKCNTICPLIRNCKKDCKSRLKRRKSLYIRSDTTCGVKVVSEKGENLTNSTSAVNPKKKVGFSEVRGK